MSTIRTPPDKEDDAIAFALPASTLANTTTIHAEVETFSTPLAAPSFVTARKRRNIVLSPSSPVNHYDGDGDKLTQILNLVKSSNYKMDDLAKNMANLMFENTTLKTQIEQICNLCESLKAEITELKASKEKRSSKLETKETTTLHFPSLVADCRSHLTSNAISDMCAGPSSSRLSFADTVKKSTVPSNPILVVKPKDTAQKSDVTLSVIRKKLTPTKLKVKNVKHTANGGIAIECGSKEAVDDIKSNAETMLGQSYSVLVPEKRHPRLKVIGLSERSNATVIESHLRSQNDDIFTNESKITISECFDVRTKFGFRMNVDPSTFGRLMMNENKRLRIGWDLCVVFEIFSTIRCFKCWRYHHTAKECKADQICGRCSSGDHVSSACVSDVEVCINCTEIKSKLRLNIECSHPAWSAECNVYRRKIEVEKRNVNYGSSE